MTEESKAESEPISISINRAAGVVRTAPVLELKKSSEKKEAIDSDDDSSQSSKHFSKPRQDQQ
jgi:hypothetical protein